MHAGHFILPAPRSCTSAGVTVGFLFRMVGAQRLQMCFRAPQHSLSSCPQARSAMACPSNQMPCFLSCMLGAVMSSLKDKALAMHAKLSQSCLGSGMLTATADVIQELQPNLFSRWSQAASEAAMAAAGFIQCPHAGCGVSIERLPASETRPSSAASGGLHDSTRHGCIRKEIMWFL